MKKFILVALLLLFPYPGYAGKIDSTSDSAKIKVETLTLAAATVAEPLNITPQKPAKQSSPASEKTAPESIGDDTTRTLKAPIEPDAPQMGQKDAAKEKLSLPKSATPGTSFSPEQVKSFLSKKEEDYIVLNFDNASLKDVILTISTITGESFILSPGLDARITIYSAGKIPSNEVLNVFESVLEVNNIALVKSGEFFKIVQGPSAKQKPIPIRKGKEAADVIPIDRPVTQIVQVDYVPATEMVAVLQPMLSKIGSIIPNPRNNLLIINDYASSINRLLKILKEIDVDAFQNTRMGFFQPKFSDVKTLSQEIKDILNGLNLGQHGIAIIPIERINSLIVFTSSPSLLKIIEGWVKKLDEQVTTGQNIFVYPLQNVKAEDIISVLKTIYETDEGVRIGTTIAKKPVSSVAAKKKQRRPAPIRSTLHSQTQTAQSRVEIVAFKPTNSLVILAPPGIYKDIVDTIRKLDIYPQEVLIEAIIAEVTLSNADQFGIQWSVLNDIVIEDDFIGNTPDFTGRGTHTSNLPGAPGFGTLPPVLGSGPGGLSYIFYQPETLVALFHALTSKGKVNILSSPRLLVKDQEEAYIEVGKDIPTATSTTSTTTNDTLTQNIEYRTVGIKLKIKPTINDEKTVVLELEQEVSDEGPNVTVGSEGTSFPSFTTTKTKTSIIVPNKQSIVIGGIMEEKETEDYQGIPILSSIPLLGNFFRYTVEAVTKKELIIIITPHVISNRNEADVLTMDFIKRLDIAKDFIKKIEKQLSLPVSEEINPAQNNDK